MAEPELNVYEQELQKITSRPFIRLAIIIFVIILLTFMALKEGFSLWVMSKLGIEDKKPKIVEVVKVVEVPVAATSEAETAPEYLVSGRGEPDFWTIGKELGAYRRKQAPTGGVEHLSDLSPAALHEEHQLRGVLGGL